MNEIAFVGVQGHLARLEALQAEAPIRDHDHHRVTAVAADEAGQRLGPRQGAGREAIRLQVLHVVFDLTGQQPQLQALQFAGRVAQGHQAARQNVFHGL
ncbi:hypothetical protein D3C81_1627940 [compost metagenome]